MSKPESIRDISDQLLKAYRDLCPKSEADAKRCTASISVAGSPEITFTLQMRRNIEAELERRRVERKAGTR